MIKIQPSRGGHDVSQDELLRDTKQHIGDVRKAMNFFVGEMAAAAKVHDHTKVDSIDNFYRDTREGFDKLKDKPWWKEHLTERHHLRDRTPDDVNLVDVMEFISDCVMAGMARSGSVYKLELPDGLLERAFQNSVKQLTDNVEVDDDIRKVTI